MDDQAKTKEQIIDKVLEQTYTRAQLIRRIRVLKDFISFKLYKIGSDPTKLTLAQQIEMYLTLHQKNLSELDLLRQEGNWLVALGEQFLNLFTPQNSSQIFKVLEEYVATIRPIFVYLPFEMPGNEIEALGQWFKQNIGKRTLYEINYDGDLIAGCALSYGGVYRDYSLKSKLTENSQLIQDAILKNLKSLKG